MGVPRMARCRCSFRRWGFYISSGILAAAWLLPFCVLAANYDGLDPYEQYAKRIQAAQTISPASGSIFGDNVSLYNGATTFGVTDVTLPGNNALPVALSRELVIQDLRRVPVDGGALHGFGDWSLDVPYIWGTFTTQNGWTLYPSGATDRCSDNQHWPDTEEPVGSSTGYVPYEDIWNGNQLHIPGSGDQELLANTQSKSPAYASAGTFKWVTSGNWKISCTAGVSNMSGEGFVAVSPSGVTYTFNYAVAMPTSDVAWQYNVSLSPETVTRENVYLLATHVQDRFGNWVNYTYSGSELTGITSSDGRSITVNWSGSEISSVTSSLGTWMYSYGTASWTNAAGQTFTWPYLSTVTRPDGSKWSYAINSGSLITNKEDWPDSEPQPKTHCQVAPLQNTGGYVYQIGAPSGATGIFTFSYDRHYRNMVPLGCINDPNPDHNYPQHVTDFFDNFDLISKQISGPGLVSQTWTYNYGAATGSYYTASAPWNIDSTTEPYIPSGDCSACTGTNTVKVTGPTSIVVYAFGTLYARNEGQLLQKQVEDTSGNVLQTTAYVYVSDTQAASESFADIAGEDLLPNFTSPMGNRNRPVTHTAITLDGATFTTSTNSFDAFVRSTSETASSTIGYSKTDTTGYQDDLNLWVLGMTASTATNGITSSQTTYDSLDRPSQQYAFGKLVSTKTWNSDGTLASVADGDGKTTTPSSWYRGIPQSVRFADGTSESAVVNGNGWITSITDQNGFTTVYAYDAMGRLAQVTYPAGDDVAWNPTLLSFTQAAGAEFGIPAGHWKQVVQTGNDYAVTYFDAFWRPLVSEHYDAGNQAGTLSQVVANYDADGRKVFMSYPSNSATSYTQSLPGTHTTYDALDRVTQVVQDSELGSLPTTTAYLTGFQTQVTNPRGYSTTTSYQVYGEPTTQWPVSISAPQGQLTTIQRDVFGKPTSITRTGTASGSPSLTRSYVYDGYQQLCKRIEPESGATAFGYDGAGNLAWSAPGLNLPDGSCDASAAESSGRVASRTYDKRNRLLTVGYADGSSNASFTYYADGALQSGTVSNSGSPVTTNYYYDKRRLLTSETLSIPNTSPFTLTYGHDANGHLASTTYPDGRTVGYTPNALGQPTAAGTYASGATYYPNGAIASFTYGNGLVHTITENERGLVDRSTDGYGGTAVHDDTYAYDGDANVAAITDGTSGNIGNRDMTYDGLDRLTETDSPMFGSGSADKALYSYDPLDNLLTATVGEYSSVAYSYNADGQLVGLVEPGTVYTLHSYIYDLQGNLSNRDGQAYQFDMANRLRNVPGVGSYLYDAAGRRVQKNETLYGGILLDEDYSKSGQLMYQWQPSTQNATDYVYLGDTLVARVVANNATSPPSAVPAAPTSITVSPTTSNNGNFSVSWPASGGASHYVLWQNANNGGADSVYSGSGTSDSITGLASGSYVYQVQACNSSGCSGFATSGTAKVIPPAPASITVPAYNFGTTLPVSWQVSPLANNYVLEEYPYNGGWGVAYEGPNTSATLTVPGSGTYQFQVAACGQGGCSPYTASGNIAVTLSPTLSASTTSSLSGAFSLSWNAVASATSYELYQSGVSNPIQTGSTTSWAASGLGDGSYTYTVKSCNGGGCGSASNPVIVTVNHIAAPGLSASTTSSPNGTFSLSWNTVTNATSYQLYQNGSLVYNATGTSWTSSNLANGTYTYTVYGCNGSTCGFGSNQVTVTVQQVPPSLSVGPTTSTNGSFTLSWNPTTDATTYQLYQSGVANPVYSGTGTSWAASGFGNGSYTYTVHACNASGCSSASNAVTATVLRVPPAPSLSASPTTSTNGSFTLSWNATTGASTYKLYQGGVSNPVYNAGGTSWAASGLGDGNYSYTVVACNTSGCSGSSNAASATVLRPSSWVTKPPSLATVNVAFGMSWSAVSGATSYHVQQTESGGRNQTTTIYSGAGTSATVTLGGLVGDTFYYQVQACLSASQCSAWVEASTSGTYLQRKGTQNAVPATGSSVP